MINAVIVDDEQNNIDSLQSLLAQFCPDVMIAASAKNTREAVEIIKRHDPHLVFLDIEMPQGNAFDILEKLMPVDFEVIFVTAFEQYALKAIKYVALDYLLKPVNIAELKNAVNLARKRIEEKRRNTRIELLLSNFKTDNSGVQKIGLPTTEGFVFESSNNIIRLQSEGSLTMVYTTSKKIITSKSLRDFETILPAATFCRIHHSHIVNLQAVKKYYKGRGGYIELTDGTKLEVSVRKKEDLLEKFGIGSAGPKKGDDHS